MRHLPLTLLALAACSAEPGPPVEAEILDQLDMTLVRGHVDTLAGDALGGRVPGSIGHDTAVQYAVDHLRDAGWEPANGDSFVVEHPLRLRRARRMLDAQGAVVPVPWDVTSKQVLAVLPGNDETVADEYVVLVAHLDHLGVTEDGRVYNGAFDDAAACSALLELARVLGENAVSFRRPILLFLSDAEEDGLSGVAAYTKAPALPLADLFAVVSIDPIGRGILPDVFPLAAIGTERSPQMRAAVAEAELATGTPVADINRTQLIGYASDQDVFWNLDEPVPAVWIASGGMTWYHTVDDTPETIDYRTIQSHLPIVAQLAGALANAEERPVDYGTQELGLADAAECATFAEVLLTSEVLSQTERSELDGYRAACQAAVDSGTPDQAFRGAYLGLFATAVLALPKAHPGPVPPPFPD